MILWNFGFVRSLLRDTGLSHLHSGAICAHISMYKFKMKDMHACVCAKCSLARSNRSRATHQPTTTVIKRSSMNKLRSLNNLSKTAAAVMAWRRRREEAEVGNRRAATNGEYTPFQTPTRESTAAAAAAAAAAVLFSST